MARSWAAIRCTSCFTSGDVFERGDERLEVSEGEDDDVLLELDEPLLPGNRVQLREFETTRRIRRSVGGVVMQRGRGICGVLEQRTGGTLKIVGDTIDHGVEPWCALAGEDLGNPRITLADRNGQMTWARTLLFQAHDDVPAQMVECSASHG